MRDIEVIKLVDEEFRSRYKPISKLEEIGINCTGSNVIITYKDGEIQLKTKVSKKEALRLVFDSRKSKKEFKNITFEAFEEQYKNGINVEDIEKTIKETQLPFEGDSKGVKKNGKWWNNRGI